ncbi:hypothetical protein MWU58_05935 [Flavobacteriaceae bacterium S0825]|uniref:hypothetical protein n=1 Tax=Gaetbulibacter sp. S0825 TaxID=2720084 RepID=UPI00142F439B|nr:hypothetical protein [Gaetbulibacter sp. S0825]MCK0108824.1 hypothetical protein [Flavobacteriaceae bacterium S0825]NIX64460.1 hypothetical protein [Gaetbulibacter sp. S0825]
MKTKFNFTLLLAFFALLTFSSCQDEVIEITEPNENQVIAPQSTLASLMRSTSSNDGTTDDIMDNANCLSINLPVTIIVNGITITITTEEDLDFIRDVFEEFSDDEDTLEFIFPITIVLNDHTEVVIENMDQLEDFIDRCENEEVIECVDFVYPISFSIYNTDFQVIETVVIENDRKLYQFMQRIENSEQAILASLNFPVEMVYANGETVEVNSNQELERVINEAEDMCDDDDDCDIDEVDEYLMECYWKIFRYNGDDHLRPYHLAFLENGQLKVINPDGSMTQYGSWNTRETDDGVVLKITEINTFNENLSGEWLIEECDDDRFKLVRESDTAGTSDTTMVLKQRCEDEPDCSAQEIKRYLKDCSWFAGTNVFNNTQYPEFIFGDDGSVIVVDSVNNVEVSGTWEVALTDYGIKLILELPAPYNDLSGYWKIYECDDDRIKVIRDDYYIVFEKECDNPFDCFENKDVVICDDSVEFDGIATFNLNDVYDECPNDDVEITFHLSEADAHDNVNALPSEYTNTNNQQPLWVRVTLAGTNRYEIFFAVLYVEDCSDDCTEEMVDSYLVEENCHWVPVTINSSNDFNGYDFYFNANQNLVIKDASGNETVGTWSTSAGTGTGVVISISQIASPFEPFNKDWIVVECGAERMVLVNDNVELIIERECL